MSVLPKQAAVDKQHIKLNILTFGIVRDIVGADQLTYELPARSTATTLMESLQQRYPALQELRSLMIAINSEYSKKDQILQENDEIALIPPVSGG